jgi:hypothetical protein
MPQTKVEAANILDTYLRQNFDTTNYHDAVTILVGEATGATGTISRALISADWQGAGIPSTAKATAAKLFLYCQGDDAANARNFYIHVVKRAVVVTQATWRIYSTGNNWETFGAQGANDIYPTAIATLNIPAAAAGNWYQFDIDPDVMTDFINGTYEWMILFAAVQENDRHTFRSADNTDAATRLYFLIDYEEGFTPQGTLID